MTPEEVLARLDSPLSLRKRVGHLILAFAGLTGSALISLLWATEPGLPPRTKVAFAVLVVTGLCWTTFGCWVVTRRTPLFAQDRVVAGWLGVGAWAAFTVGAFALTASRHKLEPALLVMVLMLGLLAAVNLRAARRARTALMRRRSELTHRSEAQ
jgi:apolipoprotein N-acyltransferase